MTIDVRRVLGILLALLFLVTAIPSFAEKHESTNDTFRCHGRLAIYNGNPSFRIWIIGTTRVLGIRCNDDEPESIPEELQKMFTSTEVMIYGDFTVTPVTKYQKGSMQIVRIDSVENVVIYKGDEFVGRRKHILE